MSYSEKDNLVILTMSRKDYDALLRVFGTACAGIFESEKSVDRMLALLDRLNSGNPNYRPYQTGEKKS